MITETELLKRLRAACEEAGGIRPFARKHKMSAVYVSRAHRGQQTIGPKIAKALGVRAVGGWVDR